MIELAMNTNTADNTIGSTSNESSVMQTSTIGGV